MMITNDYSLLQTSMINFNSCKNRDIQKVKQAVCPRTFHNNKTHSFLA